MLIVDTNIVWHHDKAEVVSPGFAQFLVNHSEIMDLRLVLPAVVRGELLFQQTTSALKSLARANENLQRVSDITSKPYSHRVTEARVRREVEERLDGWIRSVDAEVLDVPLADIDWEQVIDASIWRREPFTFDEKDPDTEKGVRDAMILETVSRFCSSDASCDQAFICNDRILREAARTRLQDLQHVALYESCEDFASFVRLTQENLAEEFVRSIRARVRAKFFTLGDPDCLAVRESLLSQILDRFADDLKPGETLLGGLRMPLFSTPDAWKATGRREIYVGATQFARLDDPRDFHWTSEITCVQPFERPAGEGLLASPFSDSRVLVLRVAVHWHAEVRRNGAFFNSEIDDIERVERSFDVMTDELRDRYGLG